MQKCAAGTGLDPSGSLGQGGSRQATVQPERLREGARPHTPYSLSELCRKNRLFHTHTTQARERGCQQVLQRWVLPQLPVRWGLPCCLLPSPSLQKHFLIYIEWQLLVRELNMDCTYLELCLQEPCLNRERKAQAGRKAASVTEEKQPLAAQALTH